jgi:hypothetical protein
VDTAAQAAIEQKPQAKPIGQANRPCHDRLRPALFRPICDTVQGEEM